MSGTNISLKKIIGKDIDLPHEINRLIFEYLSYYDLKKISQVNKRKRNTISLSNNAHKEVIKRRKANNFRNVFISVRNGIEYYTRCNNIKTDKLACRSITPDVFTCRHVILKHSKITGYDAFLEKEKHQNSIEKKFGVKVMESYCEHHIPYFKQQAPRNAQLLHELSLVEQKDINLECKCDLCFNQPGMEQLWLLNTSGLLRTEMYDNKDEIQAGSLRKQLPFYPYYRSGSHVCWEDVKEYLFSLSNVYDKSVIYRLSNIFQNNISSCLKKGVSQILTYGSVGIIMVCSDCLTYRFKPDKENIIEKLQQKSILLLHTKSLLSFINSIPDITPENRSHLHKFVFKKNGYMKPRYIDLKYRTENFYKVANYLYCCLGDPLPFPC